MKNIILFSTLTETNQEAILSQLFYRQMKNKVFSYMPSSGVDGAEKYSDEWKLIAEKYGAKFNVIDNVKYCEIEQKKLLDSNILLISGGNTYELLRNLRQSNLDKTIIEFTKKPEFILAGFSAGAIVLTPSINICKIGPDYDENIVGIDDLVGLGIVDFEVLPHFDEKLHSKLLKEYMKVVANKVITITDEDYLNIEL